jgi:D-alanine-D-alanine ligase
MNQELIDGKTVAVLLGGTSAERAISLESGNNVVHALEQAGAHVLPIDPAVAGWMTQLSEVSFAFNLLHGPGGEDGTIQGLLDLMRLPYSGSGVLGSALSMDKIRTKVLWQGAGFRTPDFRVLEAGCDWDAVIADLGTVFVKPSLEGSSLGMAKASTGKELEAAYLHAVTYGAEVLAEQFIEGAEYTISILGDSTLPSIRIEVPGDFYDFEAKYRSDETQFFCPSGLNDHDEAALAQLACSAFHAVGCAVWGRVDVIRDQAGAWHLLEVNTVPGMTSHSLVPLSAKAAGLSLVELLSRIYTDSVGVRHAQG